MKKYFLQIPFALLSLVAQSQQPLAVGDKMPAYKFKTLFNNSSPVINLNNYKGKAIILTFWKSGCEHNYNFMPYLAKWQHQYRDDLKVIMLSEVPDDSTNKIFLNREPLKNLGLPFARKDDSFEKLFPHAATPHIVLVGKDGRIKAITWDIYMNDSVMNAFVNGKKIDLLQPPAEQMQDKSKPFAYTNIINKNLLYSSMLTGYAAGIHAYSSVSRWPDYRLHFYMTNVNVKELFLTAYGDLINIGSYEENFRIKWQVKDTSKYLARRNKPADEKNLYCYELILPDSPRSKNNKTTLAYMRSDLERYFNLSAHIEKTKMACYILYPLQKTDVEPNRVKARDVYIQDWVNRIEIHNYTFNLLGGPLQQYFLSDKPLLTEGNTKQRFNFILNKSYPDFNVLVKELEKNGIGLKIEDREIDCLVISEKNDIPNR